MTNSPRRSAVPDKPSLDGLEDKWSQRWEEQGVYRFDRTRQRSEIYAIDTPPPTASGTLHIGHVFGYTQADALARYQRMRGKTVFYPIGWDDNGLPTERRVQNYYGVRCDPALPYDPDFTPPEKPGKREVPISRGNFIELCERLTREDERSFEEVFRISGMSFDWTLTYQTINAVSRTASQRAFLRNLARGEAYMSEAPTLWDVTFRTAVAQAELEDRERDGAFHDLAFPRVDGADPVIISTTRPELVPACVALVAHPDDERYAALFGSRVRTPLFDVEVPVVAHRLADPEKGTGIAMICTFGDTTDVTWWRELRLPARPVVGRDGRIVAETPGWISSETGRHAYEQLAGATVHTARVRVVELLRESGALRGEPRPIKHPVKFYERGDKPLEIVTTRQWYLRNGGRDEPLRDALLARGRELTWHPPHMGARYQNWVEGLNGDWLISRQRFYGVPIPVWYPLDEHGEPNYDKPLVPDESALPVDPAAEAPAGYAPEQRGKPNGFIGDPDIMDTWATSSLTPLIAGGWERDQDLFARVFPMDLRPQGHDIIRTWLFSSVVRSNAEFDRLPWAHAYINGWILDPDRKKMSKSKGNATTPIDVLRQHGSDAVRYWATSARPGVDTAYDVGQMKVGRRLAIKLLNVSKFVLGAGVAGDGVVEAATDRRTPADPLDRAMLATLADTTRVATEAFDAYDYARALERTETFFWTFCDDYVELVKSRAYGERGDEGAASARVTLGVALDTLLRLFAPFLPFVTDEVWSWWRTGSVHAQAWPDSAELSTAAGQSAEASLLGTAGELIAAVRKAKSQAQVSMRAEVSRAVVHGSTEQLEQVRQLLGDVKAAGHIGEIELARAEDPTAGLTVDVTLAET